MSQASRHLVMRYGIRTPFRLLPRSHTYVAPPRHFTNMNSIREAVKSLIPGFTRNSHSSSTVTFGEDPARYGPGGYHPVVLGDKFDGRYQIISRLGHGRYSTVWLALDVTSPKVHFVALKILTADSYGSSNPVFELDILRHIRHKDPTHPGYRHVVHLQDNFIHQGPNGKHLCLVLQVMGHSIAQLQQSFQNKQVPMRVGQRVASQLLNALDWLHASCGVIHTDIKPDNVLIEIPNVDEAIQKHLALLEAGSVVQSEASTLWQSVLRDSIVKPSELNVRITDFGVASWTDKHLTEWIQPPSLRAPEVFLGAPWDERVDLWCLACVIYELLQGRVLFRGRSDRDGAWTAEEDQIAQMVELFGPIPLTLQKRGSLSSSYFDESGNLLHIKQLYPYSLQDLFTQSRNPSMSSEDYTRFESFLRGMLQYEPENRLSPKELLKNPWLSHAGEESSETTPASPPTP